MSEPKKRRWYVMAVVSTGMYVGETTALTEEAAREWGENHADTPTLCHQCARRFGDLEIEEIVVEEVRDV